jgi:Lamin Tail Domain
VRKSLVFGAISLGIAALMSSPALASSALPAASRSAVVIHEIYYNSPGPDRGSNSSLNAEWVDLHNRSGHAVTLTHWTLRDAAGHVYTFGTYRLKAHRDVRIHTGSGRDTRANRYWGHSWYIWNNDGDRAALKNGGGAVRSRCSYSDPSETSAFRIC